MKKAHKEYSIKELCELFQLAQSSFYYQPKGLTAEQEKIIIEIKSIANETHDSYGKRRMKIELHDKGFKIGLYQTASLMKKADIIAIRPMKLHYYPNNGLEDKYFPNLLARKFRPNTLNTHWVGDITYIKTYQGWSYLACVLDLGSKEIVGWALSQTPNAQLAKDALTHAIKLQNPDTNQLMFHSDQGTQYSAHSFVEHLKKLKITQSMSRRGNCWDNAVMERFFRNLKTERLNQLTFINHASAVKVIQSYIRFYNYKRLNSAIDYLTPKQRSQEMKKAA